MGVVVVVGVGGICRGDGSGYRGRARRSSRGSDVVRVGVRFGVGAGAGERSNRTGWE